ncbi:MAG: hypothetical protein DMF98_21925, partial [Acidobacteria bacterium]
MATRFVCQPFSACEKIVVAQAFTPAAVRGHFLDTSFMAARAGRAGLKPCATRRRGGKTSNQLQGLTIAICVVLGFVAGASVAGQEPAPGQTPRFRSGVNLVLIDVVVR